MRTLSAIAAVALAAFIGRALAEDVPQGIPAPPGHPYKTIYSGYQFRTKETRAFQDDDMENPGFLGSSRGRNYGHAGRAPRGSPAPPATTRPKNR